jgi:hypothetical protein
MKYQETILMPDERVKTRYEVAGDQIIFLSDVWLEQILDTEVWINGRYFITIAGDMIPDFINDYQDFIVKFKI